MRKLAFIASILFLNLNYAQNTSYKFDYYDISNGLSQNQAYVIYQTGDGYIYVGSQGGLDRFDGYNFKYYSHNPSDSTSIPFGWVNSINEDTQKNLWVGTARGNVGYLNSNDEWKRVYLKGMEKIERWWWGFITDIKFFKDKVLISSFRNGFYIIENEKQKHYESDNINFTQEIHISNNKIFLGTGSGMVEFDEKTETFKKKSVTDEGVYGFSKSLQDNKFYISSKSAIYLYDVLNDTYKELSISVKKDRRDFQRIALHNGKLWIINNGYGIIVYDIDNNTSIELTQPTIKDSGHGKMFVDKDNSLWIGTAINGMMKFDPGKQKFNLYSKAFPASNPLGFDVAWGATIDNEGNYWTGKREPYGEVVKINRKTGRINRYLKSDETRIYGWSFVNTSEGLLVRKGRTFHKYSLKKDKFLEVPFTTLFPDTVGGSWGYTFDDRTFALTEKGIKIFNGNSFVLDPKLNKNFPDNNYPQSNYSVQGDFLYLWEPDSSRLYQWDTSTDQIKTFYQSKNLNQIAGQGFTVYNDTLIYIATYGFGLVELNTVANSKRYITVSDGIPSQHLYEVYASDDKNLWVSSNYGIFSYNPISRTVKSFSVADGLQDYEFNSSSSYQAKDGEMFFAGVRGLNYFYPEDIVPKSKPPQVAIQNAMVGEKSVNLNNDVIEVPWFDNKIVFDFVALNYRNPTKNQYSYFMSGYEADWIYSDNRRFATYTNLPAGSYTFKVKGSNNDGIWNEEGANISIKVFPPPWQTWWAYLIYIFSILGLGYSYSKYREKAQLKQMEDERKQSELDAAKDLQESMLPKNTPDNKNFSIETFIRSSTEVGGDYYDFFKQEDGSFYSVCGDATGHGTTAGMMVSITKAGLNGIPSLPPNEILNRLNKVVKKVDLGIIRMSLNVVHFKNGTATMANAAMPPIYHYSAKNKKLNEIEIVNLPLGGLSNEEYELVQIEFDKEDLLIQLSDGLPEAPNPTGDLIDYDRLFECIEQNAMKSPKDVVESLVELAENWLDGNINPDDITIVATKKV